MKKIDLFYGCLIGVLASFIGVFFFIEMFTDYDFLIGVFTIKAQGELGKLITLGAVLNLIVFFVLLKFNRELMARGVILATILLTIITLLV